MKRKYILVISMFLFSIFTNNGFIYGNTEKVKVETKKIIFSDETDRMKFFGNIRSDAEYKVISPTEGIISKVHVIRGEWVTKGTKIITFDKEYFKEKVIDNLREINKWKKILIQRENWKVRDSVAENNAKKNIEIFKTKLNNNKRWLANPFIRSSGEGKILRIVSSGKKVLKDGILAVIEDNYNMKIAVPGDYNDYFYKGMIISVEFPGKNFVRKGIVRSDKNRMVIFVNNQDLKINDGMSVVFSGERKGEKAILLNKRDFKTEENNYFVYVIQNEKAVKKYVELEKSKRGAYKVLSGLDEGDVIVSPIVDTNNNEFQIINNVSLHGIANDEKVGKDTLRKQQMDKYGTSEKKLEFEFYTGFSISKPSSIVAKLSGINKSTDQYVNHFDLTATDSGNFKENLLGIPFNFTVNYKLSERLYLKIGAEYSVSSNTSQKSFSVSWGSFSETFDYNIENKISNINPYIGLEKRFSSFGIYAKIGINLTKLSYKNTLVMDDGFNKTESVEDVSISGAGLGINLGAEYVLHFKRNSRLLFKLEYVFQKVGSFSGDKTTVISDSSGGSSSETVTGDAYSYEIDPFEEGWIDWWDVFESTPSGSNVRNVTNLSVNFSRIRFLIGFSF